MPILVFRGKGTSCLQLTVKWSRKKLTHTHTHVTAVRNLLVLFLQSRTLGYFCKNSYILFYVWSYVEIKAKERERKTERRVLSWAALTEIRLITVLKFSSAGTSSKVTPKFASVPFLTMSAKEDEPHSDHQILYILLTHYQERFSQEQILAPGDLYILTYVWRHLFAALLGRFGHKLDLQVMDSCEKTGFELRGTDILNKGQANPTGQIQPAVCLCMALEFEIVVTFLKVCKKKKKLKPKSTKKNMWQRPMYLQSLKYL